jgi:hypothetical protein
VPSTTTLKEILDSLPRVALAVLEDRSEFQEAAFLVALGRGLERAGIGGLLSMIFAERQ